MSNSEILSGLQSRHHEAQSKYTYFLLAASGACIAFMIEKAQGIPLTCSLIFGGIALLCWAASFTFGCLSLKAVQFLILKNATLISLDLGNHPLQPQTTEQFEFAKNHTEELFKKNMNRALWFDKLQFHLFVIGAGSFVVWRILEMIRIAPPQ